MDSLVSMITESTSLWTSEYEKEIIQILSDWTTVVKRPRQHYHLYQKYEIITLGGVSKVVIKKNSLIMATKESVLSVIKDIHVSVGHGGEKKFTKKLVKIMLIFLEDL